MRLVPVRSGLTLDDYASLPHLRGSVGDLRRHAEALIPRIGSRRIWIVNSTAQGGGVAEMLPRMISTFRELGLDVEWGVLETEREEFFRLTKRLHNMLHGTPGGAPTDAERKAYDEVARENADRLGALVDPDDLLVVHDPQPAGAGALVAAEHGLRSIWRCHIGFDATTPSTEAAWAFLQPYLTGYRKAVFSLPEYVPQFLRERSAIHPPAIDPLSHKNRELTIKKLLGILSNCGLIHPPSPQLTPPFAESVQCLQADGTWAPPATNGGSTIPYAPAVLQVSRWDRLKGFEPLLQAFAALKRRDRSKLDERHARRLELAVLVLAGPDPSSVSDDPEGLEVLRSLEEAVLELEPEIREQVFLLLLPMGSAKHNALIVNALQRSATVVVQNSIREGFGLTATEAMWKGTAVLTSGACGLRRQVEHGVSGVIVDDPRDVEALADALDELLRSPERREALGRAAQARVHEQFLLLSQVAGWLDRFAEAAASRNGSASSEPATERKPG